MKREDAVSPTRIHRRHSGAKLKVDSYEGVGVVAFSKKDPIEFVRRLKDDDSRTWQATIEYIMKPALRSKKICELMGKGKLDTSEDEVCDSVYVLLMGKEHKIDQLRTPQGVIGFLRSRTTGFVQDKYKRYKLTFFDSKGQLAKLGTDLSVRSGGPNEKELKPRPEVVRRSVRNEKGDIKALMRECVGKLWKKDKTLAMIALLEGLNVPADEIKNVLGLDREDVVYYLYNKKVKPALEKMVKCEVRPGAKRYVWRSDHV